MGSEPLAQVLRQLKKRGDDSLIVGFDTADDAAVYRLNDGLAIVSTLDFFPPIVDDPFTFGEIAAANAISDIYAMGATPRYALNIVCFPRELGTETLGFILNGASEKLAEAGAVVAGGHTIEDAEVKFGLSVTGFIDPARLMLNRNFRAGDELVLTKKLGTGIVANGLKRGYISYDEACDVISGMRALNKIASKIAVSMGVKACTDITGFGLLGHAIECAASSGVSFVIDSSSVPMHEQALRLVREPKCRPRTLLSNLDSAKGTVVFTSTVDELNKFVLCDPQTSGGLLLSIDKGRVEEFISACCAQGVSAVRIGSVIAKKDEGFTIMVE